MKNEFYKNLMITNIFNFKGYIERFNDFYVNDFPKLISYWNNSKNEINYQILKRFNELRQDWFEFNDGFSRYMQTNSYLLDYHDFQEYIDNVKYILDYILLLPQYFKTSLDDITVFEEPSIVYFVRSDDTLESIAQQIYADPNAFNIIMDNNNLRYTDVGSSSWVGRKILIPIRRKVVKDVPGIINGLIGEEVLGRDMEEIFSFENDDIKVLNPEETFNQSLNLITSKINRGSLPEFLNLGNSVIGVTGEAIGSISLPIIANEIKTLLRLEPTLLTSSITNIKYEEKTGAMVIDFNFESILGIEHFQKVIIEA